MGQAIKQENPEKQDREEEQEDLHDDGDDHCSHGHLLQGTLKMTEKTDRHLEVEILDSDGNAVGSTGGVGDSDGFAADGSMDDDFPRLCREKLCCDTGDDMVKATLTMWSFVAVDDGRCCCYLCDYS